MDFIKNISLNAEDWLVSFDVVPFFAKIPVDIAIIIAEGKLGKDATL